MSDDTAPLPDRVEGAPHPRETPRLIGQGAAERAFLDAYNAGRLHHGWLITGPRGVGKATLAWSIARFLLANSITLTPGTVSVEAQLGCFLVHALAYQDSDVDALADMDRRITSCEGEA